MNLRPATRHLSTRRRPGRRPIGRIVAIALAVCGLLVGAGAATPASAAPAQIRGEGSTYVALAMQQWTSDAFNNGLKVNYLATGSPQGLTSFGTNLADFAGTEAEYSALNGQDPGRGHQYIPSVAGAVAIMYNVKDGAGKKVNYLHLSRKTVARIFTGDITKWSDAAITAENAGVALPDQRIKVAFRSGQSGTTALFYDFVSHMSPDTFGSWAAANKFDTSRRILALDANGAPFGDRGNGLNGSDQIAQLIHSDQGEWTIGYDEFGYAKTYDVETAWIENAKGQYVLPFAENISAALESATLRPDLSQELSGVYASTKDQAYPISAYSYIVTQCAPAGDRATCKGNYSNPGTAETLTKWLRYIACEGQTNMAKIGYSPLPPQLSQFVADAIGRMNGEAPEALNKDNCKNPRFAGGFNSPPKVTDPLANVKNSPTKNAAGGGAKAGAGGSGGNNNGAAASGDGAVTEDAAVADVSAEGTTDGTTGPNGARAGGSTDFRESAPVLYQRPNPDNSLVLPLLLILGVVAIPPIVSGIRRRRS